jgi:hypothetical protein
MSRTDGTASDDRGKQRQQKKKKRNTLTNKQTVEEVEINVKVKMASMKGRKSYRRSSWKHRAQAHLLLALQKNAAGEET